jgi:hypothetical protein
MFTPESDTNKNQMGESPEIQFSSEKPLIPEKEEPVHQKVSPGTCTSQYRGFYFFSLPVNNN